MATPSRGSVDNRHTSGEGCEYDRGVLYAVYAKSEPRCAFTRSVRSCSSVGGCVWSSTGLASSSEIVYLPVAQQHTI